MKETTKLVPSMAYWPGYINSLWGRLKSQ